MAEMWPELLLEIPWEELADRKEILPPPYLGSFEVLSRDAPVENTLSLIDDEHYILISYPRFLPSLHSSVLFCRFRTPETPLVEFSKLRITNNQISYDESRIIWHEYLDGREKELETFYRDMENYNPLRIKFFTNPVDRIDFVTTFTIKSS